MPRLPYHRRNGTSRKVTSAIVVAIALVSGMLLFAYCHVLPIRRLAHEVDTMGGMLIVDHGITIVTAPADPDTELSDAQLRDLLTVVASQKIDGLSLQGKSIGDSSLTNLKRMSQLRELSLLDTRVTDKGMEMLLHVLHLQTISITSCLGITGPGVECLSSHKDLMVLELRATSYHGPYLGKLKNLQKLRALDLGITRIQDDDLRYVASLKCLERLYLDHTEITDAGVRHLAVLPKLEELNLSHNPGISDGAIESLSRMNSLRVLEMDGVSLTDKGRVQLGAAIPQCKIVWSPPATSIIGRKSGDKSD